MQSPTFPLRPLLALLTLAACLGLLGACSSGEPEVAAPTRAPQPAAPLENVLLVTFGAARADRLGCSGDQRAATPNLDRLANAGTRFETCITPAPIGLPAAASLLTGVYPFTHGARNDGTHWLDARTKTLAEHLTAAGLRTGAVVSKADLGYNSGLWRGFSIFDGDLSKGLPTGFHDLTETAATNTVDRSLEMLERFGDDAWFLWVHLEDPSQPYVAPEEFRGATPDGHGDELAYADREFGRLLDALAARSEFDSTLIVATALAGEALGEHQELGHGFLLHDATTHVPLIVHHGRVAGGAVVPGPVSLIDVPGTIAEFLGSPFTTPDARSLRGSLSDPRINDRTRFVYCETLFPLHEYGLAPHVAVRGDQQRLIQGPRSEFFLLDQDPGALNNVLQGRRHLAAEAIQTLAEFQARPSYDARAKLLGLAQVANRTDPKDAIDRIQRATATFASLGDELDTTQRQSLGATVKQFPGWPAPRGLLAQHLLRVGQTTEAIALLRKGLDHGGVRASSLIRLASMEREANDGEWDSHVQLAEILEPASIAPILFRYVVAYEDESPAAAEELLKAEIEKRPHEVLLLQELAGRYLAEGRGPEAIDVARRMQRQARNWYRGFEVEAFVAEGDGRLEEALQLYTRAEECALRRAEPTIYAARIAWRLGRREAALTRLRQKLEQLPADKGLHLEAANQALALGRFDAGQQHFEALTQLDPDTLSNWHGLIRCLTMRGDLAGTLAAAEAALEREPDDFMSLTVAAVALEQSGETERAEELLLRASAANPDAAAKEIAENPVLTTIKARLDG